jgi:rhodanese-related sulfurtransferase
MKQFKFLFYALFFVLFAVTACNNGDDTPPVEEVNEAEVLVKYLESTSSPLGKDFVATDMPTIIAATDVKTLNETGKIYIIDIRSAADFATGYIKNAKNVAFADVLTHIKGIDMSKYDKVAIVCYTGQTAGYAASLLRIMGYSKVFSMKWGMCSWHADFAGRWNTAIANGNAYASQFVATETVKSAKGNLPKLSTGKTTGLEILEARVATLLTEGFTPASITNTTVFGSLTTYQVVNYWPAAQYSDAALGHVPGAMQYEPKVSMKYAADLTTLPTNKPVVVYCYTGQTSAFLTAYLRLLGYDAKSLLYGTNGMIYDKMVAKGGMSVFSANEIKGYEYNK